MVLFGEYFTIGEIIASITMIISFILIYRICWKRKMFKKIVFAYFFFLLSSFFAVFREYFFWDFFRALEHVSLLLCSSIFLYITYRAHRNLVGD